jgi:hypothetical protein
MGTRLEDCAQRVVRRFDLRLSRRSTGRDRTAADLIGRLIEEAVSGSEGTTPEAC